jgi:galactitol-specific phosphotransferase system IIB component
MTTIESYLQGLFTYTFTEANINSVFLKRGIEVGVDEADVSVQSKELSQADLLVILSSAFSKGNESVQKGNWKRTTGGYNIGVTDRREYLRQANAIYAKYGEAVVGYTGMKDGTFLWTS